MPGMPPTALTYLGSGFKALHAIAVSSNTLTLVFVCIYNKQTDNGGTMPGKKHIFIRASILGHPPQKMLLISGGGAGNCPRVRFVYSIGRLSP